MKKTYTKPLISVEVMSLDEPIALNCDTTEDDIRTANLFGYFMNNDRGIRCDLKLLETGGFDFDNNGVADEPHDTICYHSNVQKAFIS